MRIAAFFLLVSLTLSACVPAGAAATPAESATAPAAPTASGATELPPSAAPDVAPTLAPSQSPPAGDLPVSGLPQAAATAKPRLPGSDTVKKTALAPDAPAPSPTPPFDPDTWQELPVIPTLSPRAREILADGLARGNNPRAFAKIGDCESQASWFLESYDLGPQHYSLGEYEEALRPAIEYYAGSFERVSLAAKPGFTAASLMAPIWADREQCGKNETPLACEYRLHNPLVAFILVGTNDATNPKTFEGHLRRVLDATIAQGILPVLGTKADNVEGDHQVNATMARLAYEYDLPLWNFWAAVQPLPGHGLQEDGAHLTFAAPYFDNPQALRRAWPVRNLNALQVLALIMQETQ